MNKEESKEKNHILFSLIRIIGIIRKEVFIWIYKVFSTGGSYMKNKEGIK